MEEKIERARSLFQKLEDFMEDFEHIVNEAEYNFCWRESIKNILDDYRFVESRKKDEDFSNLYNAVIALYDKFYNY